MIDIRLCSWFIFFLILFFLPGCARHGNCKLTRLVEKPNIEENVVVQGKVLTREEVRAVFGDTYDQKKMIPIQLFINNTTSFSYVFSPKTLNLKAIPLQSVARSLHKNILVRIVPLGIVSFLFWPLSVPTTILGMRAMHHNDMVDRQLEEFAIDPYDSFIIEPYSTLNRVLFVKAKYFVEDVKLELEQMNTSTMHRFSLALSECIPKVI